MEGDIPSIAELLVKLGHSLSRNVEKLTLRDRKRARPGIQNFLFKPN